MSKLSFQLPTLHQVCFLTSAVINFVIEDVYNDESRKLFKYLSRRSCLIRTKDGYSYDRSFFADLSDALKTNVNDFNCERLERYVETGKLDEFVYLIDRVSSAETILDAYVQKCAVSLGGYYYDDMFEDPCLYVLTHSGSLTALDFSNIGRFTSKAVEDLVYQTKNFFINSANSLFSLAPITQAANFLARIFVAVCSVNYRFAEAYLLSANEAVGDFDPAPIFKQFTDCMDELDCKVKMALFGLKRN